MRSSVLGHARKSCALPQLGTGGSTTSRQNPSCPTAPQSTTKPQPSPQTPQRSSTNANGLVEVASESSLTPSLNTQIDYCIPPLPPSPLISLHVPTEASDVGTRKSILMLPDSPSLANKAIKELQNAELKSSNLLDEDEREIEVGNDDVPDLQTADNLEEENDAGRKQSSPKQQQSGWRKTQPAVLIRPPDVKPARRRLKIMGTSPSLQQGGSTLYFIQIEDKTGEVGYAIHRTHNHFLLLHKKLKAEGFVYERPRFPRKKLLGLDCSEELQEYLDVLQGIPSLASSTAVNEFLQRTVDPLEIVPRPDKEGPVIKSKRPKMSLKEIEKYASFRNDEEGSDSEIIGSPESADEYAGEIGLALSTSFSHNFIQMKTAFFGIGAPLKNQIQWGNRWMVLKNSYVYIFKNSSRITPRKIMCLEYATIEVVNAEMNCFEVISAVVQDRRGGPQRMLLRVEDQRTMQEWVAALRMAKMFAISKAELPLKMHRSSKKTFEYGLHRRTRSYIGLGSMGKNFCRSGESSGPGSESESSFAATADGSVDSTSSASSPRAGRIARFNSMDSLSSTVLEEYEDMRGVRPHDSEDLKTSAAMEHIIYSKFLPGCIRGATPHRLFSVFLSPSTLMEKDVQEEFEQSFLLTYTSFYDSHELLHKLILSFREKVDKDIDIKKRVVELITKWIENRFHDFVRDIALYEYLNCFIDIDLKDQNMKDKIRTAIDHEEKKNVEDENDKFASAPPSKLPSMFFSEGSGIGLTLTDLSPLEMARQLTLIEHNLFKKVTPHECLNQRWSRADKELTAPNLFSVINRFNTVSYWAATTIVQTEQLQARIAMLGLFIEIARQCLEINNFNSSVAILSALQSSAIHRLRRTWQALPQEVSENYKRLREIMSPDNNFRAFRETLEQADLPCLPYLGVFLTDLTMIDQANTDTLEFDAHLINFDKNLLIAKVIQKIKKYQEVSFRFRTVGAIENYLLSIKGISNPKELFDLSLKCEPRTAFIAAQR